MSGLMTSTGGAINPVIDDLYHEITQDLDHYVASKVSPFRVIEGISGQYHKANAAGVLTLDETDGAIDYTKALSLTAESLPASFGITTDSVTLDRYAIHVPIPDRVAKHWIASGNIDVIAYAVRNLAMLVQSVHEYHTLRTFFGTDGNYGSTSDPGDFGTKTTAFVTPVQTAIDYIEGQLGGESPNCMLMRRSTAWKVAQLDDVRARMGTGNQADQQITMAALSQYIREFFDLELIVSKARYENASGTRDFLLDDRIAIFRKDNGTGPSFCNTFSEDARLDSDTPSTAIIKEQITYDPDGVKLIADVMFKNKLGVSGAAYALTGVETA